MTYQEAVEFLESLVDFERLGFHRHFAEVVGLDSARHFLALLGDPHRAVPAVHIAGTKGKGSTAAILESILRVAGCRTGLFTSPHLISFRERVRVNGQPMPEEPLAELVEAVQPAFLEVRNDPKLTPCTFFEAYMAIAALHFARENVDIAIYETGLGGRLDATNLLTPLVAAVTTIGFDHTAILGDTLDAIAREKAEIAKPGVPLVVARGQPDEAMRAIAEIAAKNGAEVLVGPQVLRREPPTKPSVNPDGTVNRPPDMFDAWPRQSPDAGQEHALGVRGLTPPRAILECPLLGAHQATNIGVALGILEQLTAKGYTVTERHIEDGLRQVHWPGRFDIRRARPWLVFDCAHNPESARALASALPEYLDFDTVVLVVGMSDDKDVAGFARALAVRSPNVILTQAKIERALPPGELAERAAGVWDEAELVATVPQACARALQLAGPDGAVCVTGSFYVVGEAMEALGIKP